MERMRNRVCPACNGLGFRTIARGCSNTGCARCGGRKVVADIGQCQGEDFTQDDNRCRSPADRYYIPTDQTLCDGHALVAAMQRKHGCPSCGGDPFRGLHRGSVVGPGVSMTCSSSDAQRALQDASDKVTQACCELGDAAEEAAEAFDELGELGEAMSYAAPLVEDEDEDDDGWRYGDECLTDSERNPNINRDLRSYD